VVKWAVGNEVRISAAPHSLVPDLCLCVGGDVEGVAGVNTLHAVASGWCAWVGSSSPRATDHVDLSSRTWALDRGVRPFALVRRDRRLERTRRWSTSRRRRTSTHLRCRSRSSRPGAAKPHGSRSLWKHLRCHLRR
jgi:hypothetical protein